MRSIPRHTVATALAVAALAAGAGLAVASPPHCANIQACADSPVSAQPGPDPGQTSDGPADGHDIGSPTLVDPGGSIDHPVYPDDQTSPVTIDPVTVDGPLQPGDGTSPVHVSPARPGDHPVNPGDQSSPVHATPTLQDCGPAADQPVVPGGEAAAAAAVLCLINNERLKNGRSPLVANATLAATAARYTNDMATNHIWRPGTHLSSDDITTFQDRVDPYLQGCPMPNANEIIGVARTPREMVAAWMASPTHQDIILSKNNTEFGASVSADPPRAPATEDPNHVTWSGATFTVDFGHCR